MSRTPSYQSLLHSSLLLAWRNAARERASAERASSPTLIFGTGTGAMHDGGGGRVTGTALPLPVA